jgi:hypothetical protein
VSVIVIVVLLNVALTWAIPSASIMRFTFFPIAITQIPWTSLSDLLLAGDCAAWALLGAGVGVRALTTNGQASAVTDPPVAPDVHESLDVHRDFGAQRALDAKILFDRLAKLIGISIAQVANALLGVDASRLENPSRQGAADSEDVRQADLDLLLAREIYASNTRH